MKYCQPNNLCCLLLFCISTAFAEEAAKTFGQHTRSQWLNDINHKTEAVTRNPEPVIGSDSKIIMEQSKDQQHRQKLEGLLSKREDFDGLQTFGEHRANQLETEQSPEGEAWRLLNQSPDRYYSRRQ